MLRENAKVGMKVYFGRVNGEKTLGVIEKINPKAAKVKTLEDRGRSRGVAGTIWNVPYSLLQPADVAGELPAPISYNPFQPQVDQHILMAIVQLYSNLSPENLSCDGELSSALVAQRLVTYRQKLRHLFNALGVEVSESAAYEWDNQREKYQREKSAAS